MASTGTARAAVTAPNEFSHEPERGSYRSGPERPIGTLFADLTDDLRKLLRLEIALLKTELAEKSRRMSHGLIAVTIGGLVLFSAWLVLLAAAVLGLSTVLHPWLAALIVGIAALFLASVLFVIGKRWLDAQRLVPRRTINTLAEDRAWIRGRIS
jgi:hypothetical protein